jgi:hypothetical protein
MPKSARGKKMSKASLSNGTGPGSSISLAPETVRIRDALIEKFSGAPLEDMTNFMTMALSNETDELRRLGILAARIYLLRHRVANLKEFNRNPSLTSLPGLDTTTLSLNLTTASEPSITEDGDAPIETEQWSRIQMTEPGEVNGVRFLAGTIIDAQTQDADKLIRSGKAVRVDEDGNIIEHHDDDFTDSDANANNSDETAEAVDNDRSASPESDDDTNADAPQELSEADAEMEADQPQGVSEADAEMEADQPQEADADEAPKAPTS